MEVDSSAGVALFGLARVEDPDAAAERPLEVEQRREREIRVGPRQHRQREVVVSLPGAEVERLEAEEDVVGAARRREVGRGLCPRDLPRVRLPLEERRRLLPRPGELRDDERQEGERRERDEADDAGGDRQRREREHEDEVARLRRGRAAEARGDERERRHEDDTAREQARLAGQRPETDDSERGHEREAAGHQPVVKSPSTCQRYVSDGERAVELLAARADPDVEPSREHEVGEPERDPQHADDGEGRDRLAQPIAPRDQHEHALRRQHDRPVRVRRDGREDRQRPECPGATIPPLDGAQEREVREGARKEEEAVHPSVDAVEEERPARRHEHRRDKCLPPAGEPRAEERRRPGGWRPRRRRRDPEPLESEPEVRDRPGEQEVERRAAALLEHDLEELVERVAADEEGEGLVLVRRPGEELVEQESGRREGRDRADAEQESAAPRTPPALPVRRGRESLLSARFRSSFACECRC